MTTTTDELERLLASQALGYSPSSLLNADQLHAVSVVRDLLAHIRTLTEALEPFAKAAGTLSSVAPDGHDDGLTISAFINCKPEREVTLSTADFARARAALTLKETEDGK